ncbi:MAG: insulinase family protein, partial [Gemmataceae bacterium]
MPRTYRWIGAVVCCCVWLNVGTAQSLSVDDRLKADARGLFKGLQTETLPNGLRVYLLPVPTSPVVTVMTAYKVGSCDEEKDQTGLSHYLEHLLFKGTEKLMPGDIDRSTQRNGGRNNAYTSNDITNYHFDFAADRWQIALEIEADRMRNVRIDEKHEFQQEKGAVISELKGNEDGPWDLEQKAILKLLYDPKSPYGHPIIGEEKHVRGATAEIIKRHYDRWYHPNNAVLVVCGGFDPTAALAKIKTLFSSIPKGELPERKPELPVPVRKELTRKELPSKFDVPRLLMAFNGTRSGTADDDVLEVIALILSNGRTSRLYRKFVDGERIATDVGAGNSSGRYAGSFDINMELMEAKDRPKIEQLVLAELKKLTDEPVTAAELARLRRNLLASYIFEKENVHSLADSVVNAALINDLDYLNNYLDRMLAVGPADIQRVAKKYFEPSQAVVVWSLPEDAKAAPKTGASKKDGPAKRRQYRNDAPATPVSGTGYKLQDSKVHKLSNGMTVILHENHRLPMVVGGMSINDVRFREPVDKPGLYALTNTMLEEGTKAHTSEEIARLIEDTGGSMSVGTDRAVFQVLRPDAEKTIQLVF